MSQKMQAVSRIQKDSSWLNSAPPLKGEDIQNNHNELGSIFYRELPSKNPGNYILLFYNPKQGNWLGLPDLWFTDMYDEFLTLRVSQCENL